MTHDDIRAAITGSPALVVAVQAALAETVDATPHWHAVAQQITAAAPPRLRPTNVTDRGVIAALGTDVGDAALAALEAVAADALAEGDPLAPHQGGIRRMLAWLQRDPGLDVGSARTQGMLDTLVLLGRMDPAHAQALKALGQEPDTVTEYDVRCAVLADDGTVRV